MPAQRSRVVVTRRLPEPVETRMRELFDVTLNETDTPMSSDQLRQAVREADVLVPTLTDQIDQGLLSSAGSNFKLIANYGAGVDHIDVETARSRGILVSNTPDVLSEDTKSNLAHATKDKHAEPKCSKHVRPLVTLFLSFVAVWKRHSEHRLVERNAVDWESCSTDEAGYEP